MFPPSQRPRTDKKTAKDMIMDYQCTAHTFNPLTNDQVLSIIMYAPHDAYQGCSDFVAGTPQCRTCWFVTMPHITKYPMTTKTRLCCSNESISRRQPRPLVRSLYEINKNHRQELDPMCQGPWSGPGLGLALTRSALGSRRLGAALIFKVARPADGSCWLLTIQPVVRSGMSLVWVCINVCINRRSQRKM